LIEFVNCPYAFSLSFLKDPLIIGKQDEFGQLKYNLNLDEKLVHKFYEAISGADEKDKLENNTT
jgi:hypothetical protein